MKKSKVIQKILFGSPGTGKSYKIANEILPNQLEIQPNSQNCVKTVFHPEYTYGDFMGKLLPITASGNVQYNYYEGHFLRALSQAYKNILEDPENPQDVALVIDEINRGNSSAIFGPIFQLLDRDNDGWSCYEINISKIEFSKLLELIGITTLENSYKMNEYLFKIFQSNITKNEMGFISDRSFFQRDIDLLLDTIRVKNQRIKIPPNLHIIATMNTSNESIYYMDSAFKRRWGWEFIKIDGTSTNILGIAFHQRNKEWIPFVRKLNGFIRSNYKNIRNMEDKQIGIWFIKDEKITKAQIQNKLMFFLWDSVFSRNKKPLINLLEVQEDEVVTFGDFVENVDKFITNIKLLKLK